MIIIEKYISKRSACGHRYWCALVQCEECGKQRVCMLGNLRGGHGVKYCRSCSVKGIRNHNFGKTPSEETKKIWSFQRSGSKNPMFGKTGDKCPNFGLRRSEETKEKMSLASRGKPKPRWIIEKMIQSHLGKKLSPEHRQKLREAQTGAKNSFYGKRHTNKTRQMMRQNHSKKTGTQHPSFGRHHSEQTKRLISRVKTGRYRGANSPRWNPNLTAAERERRRTIDADKLNEWRRAVFQRDKFSCQVTGDNSGGNLNAHHLYNWNTHIDRRNDINNGITLRKDIHILFHAIYGIKNNAPDQFFEFCEYMYGVLHGDEE